MKNILIIADLHHACPRIPSLVKYFHENNWNAIIVTPKYDAHIAARTGISWKWQEGETEGGMIVETPNTGDIFTPLRNMLSKAGLKQDKSFTEQIKTSVNVDSRKRSFVDVAMRTYQTFLALPDTEIPWKKVALKYALDVASKHDIHAILSSSPHPTVHVVAATLKKKLKLPWIADFRDPWTQNHEYSFPWWRKFFEEKYEVRLLKNADKIVAASPFYARVIADLHHKEVEVITNGFDPKLLNNNEEIPKEGPHLTLSYTGKIYSETSMQDPEKILKAIRNLLDRNLITKDDIKIYFYGKIDAFLKTLKEKYNLEEIIIQNPPVPWTEVFKIQKKSDILLLLNWEDKESPGVFPGKLFEYLASKTPVLATGGHKGDGVYHILKQTNAGHFCATVEEIETVLLDAIKEKKVSGSVMSKAKNEEVEKYSYRKLSENLSKIIEGTLLS